MLTESTLGCQPLLWDEVSHSWLVCGHAKKIRDLDTEMLGQHRYLSQYKSAMRFRCSLRFRSHTCVVIVLFSRRAFE